ncbi:MAG: hypothetical protein ACRCV9_07080 [Burkholderiaceae bacterium]
MAITTPPIIAAMPPAPLKSQPLNFEPTAETFVAAMPGLVTDVNAATANVHNNALETLALANAAQTSANAADASRIQSDASAIASAASAGAQPWVSGLTYSTGDRRIDPINGRTYRRLTAGAGTTAPSITTADWAVVDTTTLPEISIAGANPVLLAGYLNRLTHAAGPIAAQLPAPGLDLALIVVFDAPKTTHQINGHVRGDAAGELVMDLAPHSVYLRSIGGTWQDI